ncbi:MAG: hypothetical protein FD130_350 [Halothiobacillaceae bacterium]|nr:MAG: hypothetical protein FD130_350 [Halothiobacillaceae bacterium]
MDNTDSVEQLLALLTEQVAQLDLFDQLLEREYSALQQHRSNDIYAIASEKGLLAEQLDQTERAQQQKVTSLATTYGVTPQLSSLAIVLASNPLGNKLTALESSLLALIKQCRQKNQLNGTIINAQQLLTEKTLAILHGQTATERAKLTYGRKGKAENITSHHTLAKA